jgi:hypothetical protein
MNRHRIWLIIAVFGEIFSCCIIGTATDLISQSWRIPPHLSEYQVLRVIDGDTIVLEQLGKVRYTGIDTPEVYPPEEAEPYGAEAALANNTPLFFASYNRMPAKLNGVYGKSPKNRKIRSGT